MSVTAGSVRVETQIETLDARVAGAAQARLAAFSPANLSIALGVLVTSIDEASVQYDVIAFAPSLPPAAPRPELPAQWKLLERFAAIVAIALCITIPLGIVVYVTLRLRRRIVASRAAQPAWLVKCGRCCLRWRGRVAPTATTKDPDGRAPPIAVHADLVAARRLEHAVRKADNELHELVAELRQQRAWRAKQPAPSVALNGQRREHLAQEEGEDEGSDGGVALRLMPTTDSDAHTTVRTRGDRSQGPNVSMSAEVKLAEERPRRCHHTSRCNPRRHQRPVPEQSQPPPTLTSQTLHTLTPQAPPTLTPRPPEMRQRPPGRRQPPQHREGSGRQRQEHTEEMSAPVLRSEKNSSPLPPLTNAQVERSSAALACGGQLKEKKVRVKVRRQGQGGCHVLPSAASSQLALPQGEGAVEAMLHSIYTSAPGMAVGKALPLCLHADTHAVAHTAAANGDHGGAALDTLSHRGPSDGADESWQVEMRGRMRALRAHLAEQRTECPPATMAVLAAGPHGRPCPSASVAPPSASRHCRTRLRPSQRSAREASRRQSPTGGSSAAKQPVSVTQLEHKLQIFHDDPRRLGKISRLLDATTDVDDAPAFFRAHFGIAAPIELANDRMGFLDLAALRQVSARRQTTPSGHSGQARV